MNDEFKDKIAIVTGGGYGIGRAACITLAQLGAKIAIADIDKTRGEETLKMVQASSPDSFFLQTDVSKSDQVKALVEYTVSKLGRLDYAFNNAGIHGNFSSTTDFSEDDWDTMININLKSVWLCMKYEIPYILETHGAIVNTASAAGLVAAPSNPAYPASKHGVVGLTKSAAIEYAKSGIRINCICPGPIKTGMNESLAASAPDLVALMDQKVPMGRIGQPNEIVGGVLWLFSNASSYVTGHALPIDGGIVVD